MKKNVVVHCPTKEKANLLLQWAHEQDLKWCNDWTYNKFILWNTHKKETCYNLFVGDYDFYEHFKRKKYKIYSFEDVVLKKKKRRVKKLKFIY